MRKIIWSFLEIFETLLIALVAVVLIRVFIAQPFLVSGSSMEPSFYNGDYLLVDELTYRFRKPQRGEVVVFKNPLDDSSYYIKRIVGLPGEKVVLNQGKVTIEKNGAVVDIKEAYTINDSGLKYQEFVLDADDYFVLGDNRGFSYDSRSWGALPGDNIVGVVRLRLWPLGRVMAISAPKY